MYNVSPLEAWGTLLELGEITKVLVASGVRETNHLADTSKLYLSMKFYNAGLLDLSRILYRSIDPQHLIIERDTHFNEDTSLHDWAFLTLKFDGKDAILSILPRLVAVANGLLRPNRFTAAWENNKSEGSGDLVFYHVGIGAIDAGFLELACEQFYALEKDFRYRTGMLFINLGISIAKRQSLENRHAIIEAMLMRDDLPEIPENYLLILSNLLLKSNLKQQALNIFNIARLENNTYHDQYEQVSPLLKKNCLMLRLGLKIQSNIEIPISHDNHWPDSYLDFILSESIRKLALLDLHTSLDTIIESARWIAERCVLPKEYDQHKSRTYRLKNLLKLSIQELITISKRFSRDALNALHHLWFVEGAARAWSSSEQRLAITSLANAGLRNPAIIKSAEKIDMLYDHSDPSGRVESAKECVTMWMSLSKESFARAALKKMHSQSFGVGYRKDYQLDSFISPLRNFIKIKKTEGVTFAEWMISKAITLCDSIEERAPRLLIEEVLQILAEQDPLRAAAIGNRAGPWLDSIAPIARALIARGDAKSAVPYLVDIAIPLLSSEERVLTEELFKALPNDERFHARFIENVCSIGARSERRKWIMAAICGLLRAGIYPDNFFRELKNTPYGKDDDNDKEQVAPENVAALVENQNRISHWNKIKFLKILPKELLESKYLTDLSTKDENRQVLSQIALRSLRNGDRSLAEILWRKLSEKKNSDSEGWLRYLDGGGQIEYYDLGIQLGHAKPVDAISDFVSYVITLSSPVMILPVFFDLERICGMLWDCLAIWHECQNYLESLLSPVVSADLPSSEGPSSLFEWVIKDRLDSPIFVIRDAVRRFALHAILEKHNGTDEWIRQRAREGHSDVAVLLASASISNRSLVEKYRDSLTPFFIQGDARARQLLEELSWISHSSDLERNGIPVMLIEDAFLRIRDMTEQIGIDAIRAVNLGLRMPIEEVASTAFFLLQTADINVSPNRVFLSDTNFLLRARFLIRELIRKLSKPGSLGHLLDSGLRCFDPILLAAEHRRRPSCVYSPHLTKKEELGEPQEIAHASLDLSQEWISVGEVAFWQARDRNYNIDRLHIRRGFVVDEDGELFDQTYKDALRPGVFGFTGHPLVTNNSMEMDDWLRANWIFLTDSAAASLGWHLQFDDFFQYYDQNDQMVAEIVLWRDGQFGTSEHRSHGPKGMGSSLLIRKSDLNLIKKFHQDIKIATEIIIHRNSGKTEEARSLHQIS